ncbi:LysM peptidoglycan-binding domain-containing protein [Longimicrobium sp.]|uniref:LysM peptidoglycan-binding domain-containing protein n=1 Tax=Longimicrobium sp. TaxID=2029185 RepID=UPI002F95265A
MRKAASVIAAAGLLAAAPLAAQDEQPARVHVVRPGETLWDIARAYLDDPFLWPEIFRLNTDVVEDPARIYPSERLVLPAGTEAGEPAFGGPAQGQPDGPRVQFGARSDAAEVLQGDFYRASFLAREGEVRAVGRLTEPLYESVVEQRVPGQLNLYDRVFVVVDPAAVRVGDRLHFLRRDREIRGAGRVYEPTGVGTVAALDGSTATVVIVGMFDRVAPNDIAVPWERFPVAATARSRPVDADLQGRILGFGLPSPIQRTESILFLDVGRDAGVGIGDVFEAYAPPRGRDWGTRPEVSVARMQVVKVTGRTASVRVTHLAQPSIRVGLPVRRVARMP